MERLKLALALAAVIAVGEGAAAIAAGAGELELLLLQAALALPIGLVLALLPLPARWILVLPVLGFGLFHVANLGVGLESVASVRGILFLLAHAVILGAGLGWCTGAWGRGRSEPRELLGSRAVPAVAAAHVTQAVWCAQVLSPLSRSNVEATGWVALLCASLVPVAAAWCVSLLVRPDPRRAKSLARIENGAALLALLLVPWTMHERLVWSSHTNLPPPEARTGASLHDVLFIVMDTTRADRMSVYGYPRPTTPRLEELARGATVYARAISQAIWTLPSHASMFTGLYPPEHGADWESAKRPPPLPSEAVTLAERFRAAGYRTACISANQLFIPVFGLTQGFEVVWAKGGRSAQLPLPWLATQVAHALGGHGARQRIGALERNQHASAGEVRELGLRWLERAGGGPRLLFLNFMEAHGLLHIPSKETPRFGEGVPMNEFVVPRYTEVLAGSVEPDPQAVRRLGDWYDSQLAFLDLELGRLFDELRRRGLFDELLIVVASDHGEMLGDHRSFNHKGEIWEGLVRVPLIIKLPGQREGSVCTETVETSDLAAALPRLAGLPRLERVPAWAGSADAVPAPVLEAMVGPAAGGPAARESSAPCPLPGRSEVAVSRAAQKGSRVRRYPARWDRGYVAIRDGDKKFVEDTLGRRAVYDLDRDPEEASPRDPTPEEEARMEELLGLWRGSLGAYEWTSLEAGGRKDAAERLRAMRQLGYVTGDGEGN
jgi:arylsulfatase A-like enzyme